MAPGLVVAAGSGDGVTGTMSRSRRSFGHPLEAGWRGPCEAPTWSAAVVHVPSPEAGLHMIEIVSATRLQEAEFAASSALGLSLRRLGFDGRLTASIAFANRSGLPDVFNSRILAADSAEMLVFMHDDVWIEDQFLADRVIEGLRSYDVIGVAGNRRRVPGQPAWAFVDPKFTWDERANLSGSVAHGSQPFGAVSYFGPVPSACELLDGVFLAARKSSLVSSGVLFDPRFDFHFYDMDFCRSARGAGLRLGTWPVCLTHQSGGAFGGERWRELYRAYLAKWGT